MLITTALLAAPVVAIVGIFIFWANPARRVNQMVFLGTLQTAAWLTCWHLAVTSPQPIGLYWLRWTSAVGALAPLCFWIVKESILGRLDRPSWRWVRESWGWLILPVVVAYIPFTEHFIPAHSTGANRVYGWGYYFYMGAEFFFYALLLFIAVNGRKALTGAQRLELQVWLGGGCSMFIAVWSLSALSTATQDPTFRRLMPIAVLLFYGATAVSITLHRIFDARQIVLVSLEKTLLVIVVAGVAFFLDASFSELVPPPLPFLGTVTISLWVAVTLNGWLNRVFQFYPQAMVARQATFAAARNESRVEKLEEAFRGILKGWGQTETAIVASGRGLLKGREVEIVDDDDAVKALRQLRWATPERLMRERTTTERSALLAFLARHGLGVVVMVEGATLSAIVGVGISASRRPFTYPQVTQLMELASIIENALERAHFGVKAQHAEQLATVGLLGASLAHEIRNPLVTIKTFVQLLPRHHQDPVFREKFFTLIGDEVTRIDRLTEQLLDLASPRAYQPEAIQLHPVLRSSLELVSAKAMDKRIDFLTDFQAVPDGVFTDASAARQVLLNLCFNAIQAVEVQSENRWVKVSTQRLGDTIEVAVEDSGPGISPEIRPRLFQPFQSTKSSGFGLGLAICSDILVSLNATISVDPATPGRGAVFRIVFPCQA